MEKESNIVSICPYIYNIEPFIVKEHPIYHPDTKDYLDYWEDIERKCIEGLWGLDSDGINGGYRYMPPQLFYYTTCCVIEQEDEISNSILINKPLLRDVEWLFFYAWFICRGFSGFEDDDEYTCNFLIGKLQNGEELSTKDKLRIIKFQHVFKKDGTYKTYIDPLEYLFKTFDKVKGLPVYENEASNLMALTSRRQGKSMWLVAILSHIFKFHGAIRYDNSYFNLQRGPAVVIGSVLNKAADTLKHFAFLEEYQKHNLGSWGEGDEFIPGYFYQQTAGSLTVSNQKSPYRNEYEEKINGVLTKQGKGTRIVHVTYDGNPEASVGQGPIASIIEEVGVVMELLRVLGANEPGLTRNNKFGSHLCIGTAGNMEKIAETKQVAEDPETYKFLGFKDHWENRKKKMCLFIPATYVDNSIRDPNGNQDLVKAYQIEMEVRKKLSQADNSSALTDYMMSRPLVPSEMFLSGSNNIFPVAMLRERLTEVEIKDIYKIIAYKGMLDWVDNNKNKVKFEHDWKNTLIPINDLDLNKYKYNLKGCITFFEAPEEDIPDPTKKSSLYKIVYDPVRDDGKGTSLASILVYKGVSDGWSSGCYDDIVAEYIGRHDLVDDVHEIALKLAVYYNAKIMVETNIPDFIRYCRRENKLNLLAFKPIDAISDAVKNPGNKYTLGIDMSSPALQEHAEQLGRQWLLRKWKTNEDGNSIPTLFKIKSIRLLNELINYSKDKGNYDHVSSFKLLMLWLAQESKNPIKKQDEIAQETIDNYFNKIRKQNNKNTLTIY